MPEFPDGSGDGIILAPPPSTEMGGESPTNPGLTGGVVNPNFGSSSAAPPPLRTGAYRVIAEFIDPNDTGFKAIIPASMGTTIYIEIAAQLGTWGSTEYKAYKSADGSVGDLTGKTALATLNSAAPVAALTAQNSDIVVLITTAHGSTGNRHKILATGITSTT